MKRIDENLKTLLETIAKNSPQLDSMKVLEYLIEDEAERISKWNEEVKKALDLYQGKKDKKRNYDS